MAEYLRDKAGLEAYIATKKVKTKKNDAGDLMVEIEQMPAVEGWLTLRYGDKPGVFECVTAVLISVRRNRNLIVTAVELANRTLPAGVFIVGEHQVFHVANAFLNDDGTLSTAVVDKALASAKSAMDEHFREIFAASNGHAPRRQEPPTPPAPPAPPGPPETREPKLLVNIPGHLSEDQIANLRLAAAAERPSFVPRLARPVMVEEVKNPWFRRHRILYVQSPSPMPAVGIYVAVTPDGLVRILTGQPDTMMEIAAHEKMELESDKQARAFTMIVTGTWTRSSDYPEFVVNSFDDIPFRQSLSDEERAQIETLRGEVGSRIAPISFVRERDGWSFDVWLISMSRLVHRHAGVARDGTVAQHDEVVAADIPVPLGAAWGMVNGRLVPVM